MQHLKFDGYAMDYIDCPEGMRYFLMKELNLHRTVRSIEPFIAPFLTSATRQLHSTALQST